jgi:hypothetical protein
LERTECGLVLRRLYEDDATKRAEQELRLLVLHYHDGRDVLKTDNRPLTLRQTDLAGIRINTLGGHYLNASKLGSGKIDVLLWGVGQFGSWGRLDHRAGALAAEGGYQLKGRSNAWVRTGYFRGSGDGNSTGRQTHNVLSSTTHASHLRTLSILQLDE